MPFQQQNLQNNLKEFGLNPKDWNLLPMNDDNYLILSKEVPGFIFKGLVQKANKIQKWEQLELMILE